MTKRFILTLAMTLCAQLAAAQPRPSTVDQPCETSQRLVARHGAIVLGTGGFTYDRFVRDRSFCQRDEVTEPAWVPSRDRPSCLVGSRCRSRSSWID